MPRENRVVLLAGEPFFLRGRDDLAVHNKRRGAVVVESGNPENTQRPLLRTACRRTAPAPTLGQHEQAANEQHQGQNRDQPVFPACPNKREQLT